ncbi:MAG: FtsX-like permease family protein [Desulfovibrio sp.]|jgi:putative ABC transport system permease protein|nr:FtsX-like permease family protein [Desulfovibrio sp.]
MSLLTLPARHLRAKWMRSLLLAAVFTLGLASMSGLYEVSTLIADNFEKKLISYGANILVTPRHETLKISYGGYSLGDVSLGEEPINLAAALPAVDAVPLRGNIAVVAPKMLAAARIDGRAVALVGVDWEQELQLKGYWETDGEFPQGDDATAVLVGATAAEKLGLRAGRTLHVDGRELRVAGILKPTGNDDDTVLFVHLSLAQESAGQPGRASFLEVAALCSGCPIEDITAQLQSALPGSEVRALAQVAESRMYSVRFAQNLAFSVSIVILLTACAMLVMSMLSSVAERKREIGIMRAVGFSRAGVAVVFVAEALCIGLAAGICGYAAGRLLTVYVLHRLQTGDAGALGFDPAACAAVVLLAVLSAGLAALFPAWRAGRVEPAEALVAL